jgi:hypothetical protein
MIAAHPAWRLPHELPHRLPGSHGCHVKLPCHHRSIAGGGGLTSGSCRRRLTAHGALDLGLQGGRANLPTVPTRQQQQGAYRLRLVLSSGHRVTPGSR